MVTFITGGARSGKSSLAERLALERFAHPLYLATGEVTDPEMAERIARHRARRGSRWSCLEEPLDLAGALTRAAAGPADGIVLECLTTWLGNVLHHEDAATRALRVEALLEALRNVPCDVIVVSNEVGMGIVPATELGREFRDLAGRLNQAVASLAGEAAFVVAGLPLWLKGRA